MTLTQIDEHRKEVTKSLKQSNKSALGQFFTPVAIANFMCSLFSNTVRDEIKILDPGAGIGVLSTALLHNLLGRPTRPQTLTATTYEIDPLLISHLQNNLNAVGALFGGGQTGFTANIVNRDYILDAIEPEHITRPPQFSHAILNPPYKKIATQSKHRAALRLLGIETVNLYSGFVAVALKQLIAGGELVAIIPRSFCNGPYYLPFRKYILAHSAIKQIHLFNSRTEPFNDEEILQENVIIHLVKGVEQGSIIVSKSTDATFNDLHSFTVPFERIVTETENSFFHIPDEQENGLAALTGIDYTLAQLGLNVSTGPVVDFRLSSHLSQEAGPNTVPLLYSNHFGPKEIIWPVESKKPNAIAYNDETKRWLLPNGFYTVTKRFSSKEERQRIVARVINPGTLPGDVLGLENHLNVFHAKKQPLPKVIAYGLAAYLNSALVDEHFRLFSGHTQVNATDLKQMTYPSLFALEQLGRWALLQNSFVPTEIDQQLTRLCQTNSNMNFQMNDPQRGRS